MTKPKTKKKSATKAPAKNVAKPKVKKETPPAVEARTAEFRPEDAPMVDDLLGTPVEPAIEDGDAPLDPNEEDEPSEGDDDAEVNAELDQRVLDAIDGSGAELSDLAQDLRVSQAEIRASTKRLEKAEKIVVEKDDASGGTYLSLPTEEGETKVQAVKSNGAANGKSNGVTSVTISGAGKSVTFDQAAGDRLRVAAAGLKGEPVDDESEEEEGPTRNLKCILSPEEKAEKSATVAQNFQRLEDLEAERDRLNEDVKSVKGKIDGVHLDNRRAMRAVREGYEYRDVRCEEQPNLVAMKMETIRLDTLEVINSRDLTKTERQGDLFDKPITAN